MFIILINDLGFEDQSNDLGDIITCKRKIKEFNLLHLKYVDDFTIAEAISMKDQLDTVPLTVRPQPDNFHDSTVDIPWNPRTLEFIHNLSRQNNMQRKTKWR